MWANQGAGTRYLAGVEVGYLFSAIESLGIVLARNFMGYQDAELASTSSTGEGAYLRFEDLNFDEDLFGRRNGMMNPA